MRIRIQPAAVLTVIVCFFSAGNLVNIAHAQSAPESSEQANKTVATVNGATITLAEFNSALTVASRRKFYHGKVSKEKLAELKKTVIEDLILRHLLLQDASQKGIEGDESAVEKRIAEIEKKNSKNAEWHARKKLLYPRIRQRLLEITKLGILETEAKKTAPPSTRQLKDYYEKNKKKFTLPQRERVSLILLGVEPGSPPDAWQKAEEEAGRIAARLAKGANFSDLAKLHSSDESSSNGGDMGFLHRGMLAEPAQKDVDKLKIGETTPPVKLLQGYALLRLIERQKPVLRPFSVIRERIADFYKRDKAERQWIDLKARLRANANIAIYPSLFLREKI